MAGDLGTRVMQLEYKIKAMAQRERKQIIWTATLESFILKNFNYDLRLEVQLKLLQSESEPDDFEKNLLHNNNSPTNRVFMGQTSITKTRTSASASTSSMISSSGQSHPHVGTSPIRQIPPNLSITTMPAPSSSSSSLLSFSQSQQLTHQLPTRNMMHGGGGSGIVPQQSYTQGVRQMRPVQTQQQKRKRIANNVGSRQQNHQRMVNNSTLYSKDMPTPIIVSTSSMAPKKPVKSPELIVLDDEEDDKMQTNVNPSTTTSTTVSSVPLTSTITPTTICSSFGGSINSSILGFSSDLSSRFSSNNNNNCSSTNSLCSLGSVASSSTSMNNLGNSSDCINTTSNSAYNNNSSTANFYTSPPPYNNNSSSSGIPNFSGPYLSSTDPTTTTTMFGTDSNNSKIVQNLEMFVDSLTHCRQPLSSVTGDTNGGDSENSNGYDPSYVLQLESNYATNNYITRNEGVLMFNIRKILLDYEPSLHTELIQTTLGHEDDLPVAYKKRINANVCHFLMQVYGEQVPTIAKQAMADSLFDTYPGISKEEWFKKLPHKNATGCIHSRLASLRKTLRDQRKSIDPSLILV